MRERALLLAGLAVMAVVAVLAFRWWSSDERAVRARLTELAETLSVPAGTETGGMAMVGRIATLRGFFAPDVEIRFGSQQLVSRDALVALLGRWSPPPGGLTVDFVDASVTLDAADRSQAQVYLTATVRSRNASGEDIVDAREAHVRMLKQQGEWVIAAVKSAETLTRP